MSTRQGQSRRAAEAHARGDRYAVRYREDNPADLQRARAAVAAWRDQKPTGTGEELVAAIGHQFHRDYAVVLRAVLFAVDRHRAHQVTGLATRATGIAP
jgi:hypothetical protein